MIKMSDIRSLALWLKIEIIDINAKMRDLPISLR